MAKSTDAKHDEPAAGEENNQQRLNAKAAARPPGPGAKDRAGFDLGGAVTGATAGSGLGLWPAAGSEDTELGVLMEPEVGHGEAEVYTRVQA